MGLLETALLYALMGIVVAAALMLRQGGATPSRLLSALVAVPFWPLFAPVLFTPSASERPRATPSASRAEAIEARLAAVLPRLHGLAQELLAPELVRLRGLSASVAKMEARIA